jgi:hypothetical protein
MLRSSFIDKCWIPSRLSFIGDHSGFSILLYKGRSKYWRNCYEFSQRKNLCIKGAHLQGVKGWTSDCSGIADDSNQLFPPCSKSAFWPWSPPAQMNRHCPWTSHYVLHWKIGKWRFFSHWIFHNFSLQRTIQQTYSTMVIFCEKSDQEFCLNSNRKLFYNEKIKYKGNWIS